VPEEGTTGPGWITLGVGCGWAGGSLGTTTAGASPVKLLLGAVS